MSVRKKLIFIKIIVCLSVCASSIAQDLPCLLNRFSTHHTLAEDTVARELGWVVSDENYCGGYYLEEPFTCDDTAKNSNAIFITSNEGFLSQHGTSIMEGKVTVTRGDQQMTANKAYLYRHPNTGKLSVVELIGDVHFREPNTLIIGKKGRYNFDTKTKSLIDLSYRTSIAPPPINTLSLCQIRKISSLTAWGEAYEFSQTAPLVYELYDASFSTCPPLNPAWKVKAGHIVLDKNTGRGYATHARLLVKNVPVFYVPYFSFSIDRQRKSGFLWPSVGGSNRSGPAIFIPFYWNMAPNYDMTITPGYLSKRGVQINDCFRYLSSIGEGSIQWSILPNDKFFRDFQEDTKENPIPYFEKLPLTIAQAELNRLLNASTTRKAFIFRDDSRFNPHWSSHIDFNYAGDDYYLADFGSNLNDITENTLLQEGDLYYRGENWNFIGRIQAYQTLHPINEPPVKNQYRRFPQLILKGDYPNQPFGFEYFIYNEFAHFEILKTPGSNTILPIGNRLHTQPGISLPLYWPFFYITPRFQLALTNYQLQQTAQSGAPNFKHRSVPIFDIASGFYFNRNVGFYGHHYEQTLEPQVYYTYIPYRNQANIPVFDTTVSTLVYDQIFNYNRFSGLDRIGDANQIGIGIMTRFIDTDTGIEKIRLGIGDIIYFSHRRVTLCNSPLTCTDNPFNPSNHWALSPLSGLLNFNIIPYWSLTTNVLWNPISKQLDNTTINLHYQTDNFHILNFGYQYAHNGDIVAGLETNSARNNLKVTTFSFSSPAPLLSDVSIVGLWSQNWNRRHLQNLLYGVQYDTCCWQARLVAGRAFLRLDPANNYNPQFSNQIFIQFDLKGLGNISSGNPNRLLKDIAGYNTQFGQEF